MRVFAFALFGIAQLTACSKQGSDGIDGGGDGDGGPLIDAIEKMDSPHIDGPPIDGVDSTMTATCTTLQGRAIVNFNNNLSIAFTDPDPPYAVRGSIQFEFDNNFVGPIPNPENYPGTGPRRVIGVSSPAPNYQLHGNHCWFNGAMPTGGSGVIDEYRPADGVVRASFAGLQLRICSGTTAVTCEISGAIATSGLGVFE